MLPANIADLSTAGILFALFVGTFVSEDLACLSAGSLAAAGRLDLAAAIGICFAGIFIGDLLLYGAGRTFGARILSSRYTSRWVGESGLQRARDWLSNRRLAAIFASRFISGLRLPTYIAAGALRMDAKRFTTALALAAAVWTPLIVGAAAIWQTAFPMGAVFATVAGLFIFRFTFRLTNRKKRRLAWARVQRIVRWEFWPIWFFYAPVIVYVLRLVLRHRGLAFTAANPGMPAGGFVGESKDDIYKLIARSGAAREHLLAHGKIPAGLDTHRSFAEAMNLMEAIGGAFPIVLKPDTGERGDGVSIVHNEKELLRAVGDKRGDLLLQAYFDGVEASVFYCRAPQEERGRIFSITEKCFPTVRGDGVSTLEELILRDERAYIVANKYFDRNRKHLGSIPLSGEWVQLVDIGSHSKGAIFRDGEWLRTAELEAKIDEICRDIPGFYFGRLDIRASNFDDLKRGHNFRIIELNGVTSESTNIYDRRYSLIDAYRILFRQWRLAFEIGAENAARGARVTTLLELISIIIGNKGRRSPIRNVHPFHRIS